MRHVRRSVLAVAAASLASLLTAVGGVAALAAPAGGVKGDPQPEVKPFKISNAQSSPGTIALEPSGSIVTAYDVPSGVTGKIVVCQLNRGARSCARKTSLGALSGDGLDTVYGPKLLVTSANHVAVLADTCCDSNTNGDTLFYSSTNGGTTFAAPVRIGNVTTGAAELIGRDIVFIGSDFPDGIQVESIPLTAAGPPASVATLAGTRGDVGIGSYHGGVLGAFDYDGTILTTYVDYAPAHSDFSSKSSYHKVTTIKNEQLIAISGNALLTIQTGGKQSLELRLFNGKSFGSAHAVPGSSGGGPEWFGMEQDPSGEVHVFEERSGTGYDLVMASTSNGTHWRRPANLGNAITSYSFSAALDSHGSGVVIGPGGNQVWAFPVLATQGVSFALKSSTIKKGKSTTGSGKGSPAGVGRLVELQVERSGRWYTVGTTHEKSGGSFSFTIKGSSKGRFDYRAVVSDLAGYLMFGYSPARSLRVTG